MRFTRKGAYIVTAVSALLYILLEWAFGNDEVFNPGNAWFSVTDGGVRHFGVGVFWSYLLVVLIVAAGVWQANRIPDEGIELGGKLTSASEGQIEDPHWWRLLSGNVYLAVLWLPIRFFVGRSWFEAGEEKIHSAAWMKGGTALVSGNPEAPGFWERIAAVPEPPARPAITYDWYRHFIQFMIDNNWASGFGKLIAVGELLVGVGLLVGALVGIAAFFGTTLNMSFMLAGTTSTNPVLFGLTVFIILGWKVAGWIGLDRYLLPLLGTPWQQGKAFGGKATLEQPAAPPTTKYA